MKLFQFTNVFVLGTFSVIPYIIEKNSKFKVLVINSMLLDYETRKSVQCYIVARKNNTENYLARTKLTVILNDVNDNPPKFSQEEYHGKYSLSCISFAIFFT